MLGQPESVDVSAPALSGVWTKSAKETSGAGQTQGPADAPSGHEAVFPYGSTATTFLTSTEFELAEHPFAVLVPATRRLTRNNLPTKLPAGSPNKASIPKLVATLVWKFENVRDEPV